ncbi:hypothetical protein [Streptomyces sp. NBC_00233]|uniref:hypothetical protein n=1 Tax=Streptomyces sp. NBC_00233 TaxID=2975686 RepID=UPI0022557FE8|nr:hypothetical protein [Streptomyces sp. NBC_00233]MCX5233086.1 hypothetical protein [Streptomyces sp. NBC_00233]
MLAAACTAAVGLQGVTSESARLLKPGITVSERNVKPPKRAAIQKPVETEAAWDGRTRMLGDGSTSYTGPQRNVPAPGKLKPGEKPPQFIVFSWDGALEGDERLFSHYLEMSKRYQVHMTFFLTGIYLLPSGQKSLYVPPRHPQGSAAISFPTRPHIRMTLEALARAWKEGHEIGSHFNGHFCGKKGGGDWSANEWRKEIQQFYGFVNNWKTNTGFADLPPLPFDPKREVIGGRAPCLEGQKNLMPAIKSFGWRYDASSPGDFQVWPRKKKGVWDFPLQMLPYERGDFQALSMDFNFLYNQSAGNTDGDLSQRVKWLDETRKAYLDGFNRVYHGSRAPLLIGNHFENWNGGIYMQAVDDVIKSVCVRNDVRCVSFRELANWLDVQDPEVLESLRALDPAQSPDWNLIVR